MITQADLKALLHYDPETGVFTWAKYRNCFARAGQKAGYQRADGYLVFTLSGHGQFLGHRLAWLYVTGAWPDEMIDHVNGDPSDTRFVNLRPATRSQNMMNMALPPSNTSGVKGVSWNRRHQRWEAYITLNRKQMKLGTYRELTDAAQARKAAEQRLFGEFARGVAA
jgi:hypothetical protein